MMLGAVKLRPYSQKAYLVANLTILEAKTGPYVSSHKVHMLKAPAKMSPIPPHLFRPPLVLTTNDFFFVSNTSFSPFMNRLKGLSKIRPLISQTSSSFFNNLCICSMSISICFCKYINSLAFGVKNALNLPNSDSKQGCWHRKQMPSASKITRLFYGNDLTNLGKNSNIYLSLPNPGPIIHTFTAAFHYKIRFIHSSCIF